MLIEHTLFFLVMDVLLNQRGWDTNLCTGISCPFMSDLYSSAPGWWLSSRKFLLPPIQLTGTARHLGPYGQGRGAGNRSPCDVKKTAIKLTRLKCIESVGLRCSYNGIIADLQKTYRYGSLHLRHSGNKMGTSKVVFKKIEGMHDFACVESQEVEIIASE